MRPARLEVAQTEHYFGLRDSRDPQVLDPTLGVLRATATNGRTVATLLFWGNHPETTLFWEPPTDAIADECAQIGLTPCTFEDRYFTADFPGWATRIIEDELGGEALYFNGAIGDLITPLGANVWEVDDSAPLGLGLIPPDGAQPPLGAADFEQRNFRRTYLIGRELATAALGALDRAKPVMKPKIDYDVATFYTRMSNIGFRLLLVPGDDGLTSLGHTPALLYTCPATGPKDDSTCVSDDFGTVPDDLLVAIRAGDHTRSQAAYLRIGPVGAMFIPAEIGAESTIGLPAGYLDSPATWHLDDPALHAFGAEYTTVGYVKNRMHDKYRWIVGLGNDEMGYVVPLADYRVRCVADDLRRSRHVRGPPRRGAHRVPRRGRRGDVQGRHRGPVVAGGLRPGGRGDRRQLQVRPGPRRSQRPLRGDELRRLGHRGRHPRRGGCIDRRHRPGDRQPGLPRLVDGLHTARLSRAAAQRCSGFGKSKRQPASHSERWLPWAGMPPASLSRRATCSRFHVMNVVLRFVKSFSGPPDPGSRYDGPGPTSPIQPASACGGMT